MVFKLHFLKQLRTTILLVIDYTGSQSQNCFLDFASIAQELSKVLLQGIIYSSKL